MTLRIVLGSWPCYGNREKFMTGKGGLNVSSFGFDP